MTTTPRHQEIEANFLDLVEDAGLPAPDDIARLSRALIFLWYESKAFVLVDLDELPDDEEPLDALDLDALRADVTGLPPDLAPDLPFGSGFAETA